MAKKEEAIFNTTLINEKMEF